MNEKTPYNLVEFAFNNKDLDQLFLGIPPYTYRPKFSGAPGNIDLTAVIPDGIFPYVKQHESPDNVVYLKEILNNLSNQYNGLDAVATYILCATLYKRDHGKLPLEIDINELANKLKRSIKNFEDKLKKDFTGIGFGNKEGAYDDFKRLSLIVQKDGGPNFFPEDIQSIKI